MESLNYFVLPFQSNIYGLSCLQTEEGHTKVLTATVERQIFCMEYHKSQKPSFREIQFTYIPSGADIISIDTFKRSNNSHDYVVGITFVKPRVGAVNTSLDASSEMADKYYFNIYASWSPLSECNIDYIAQGCLTLEIDFVPYHLYHTHVFSFDGHKEFVWLLSGSDSKIHCFRENKERQCFFEEVVDNYFPEFKDLTGIVMWMDVYYLHDWQRLSAVGCENGSLRVCLTKFSREFNECEVLSMWTVEFDSPISSVRFFMDQSREVLNESNEKSEGINLLVVNSLETSVVFRDIWTKQLRNMYLLPESKRFDCSVTSCVGDFNLDGINEVAVGTFAHELLTYKFDYEENKYKQLWMKLFSRPLQALAYVDITGDGLKELLVLTNKGLHVLQHNLNETRLLVKKRIEKLLNFVKKQDNEAQISQLKSYFSR